MTKTAILLGNGVFDTNMKHYKDYVDEFAEFVKDNRVDRVIISGGHTHSKTMSEAWSIKRYLAPTLDKRVKLLTEEKSLTASQCIRFIGPMLKLKKDDDVTVFCDSVIAVKVMWFVMHYWFGLNRKEIENDAMDYVSAYYSNKHGTEDMGKSLVFRGVHFENVDVHPCSIRPSVESAIAQQLVSLVDVGALYNKKLYGNFVGATKKRYGSRK